MTNNILELGVVDSTQTYIKNNIDKIEMYDCCYSTIQTNGYGRTGKWESNFENLYFSKLLPKDKYNHLTAICSMHMLVSKYASEVEIKVPNDLYTKQTKLGGFIIENIDEYAILGIGININGAPADFTSLSDLTNTRYDIDKLATELDELINLNLTVSAQMLEQYYTQNCKLVGKNINYIELASNDQFNGTVTALDSETITIDSLKFNQMQIKILNK